MAGLPTFLVTGVWPLSGGNGLGDAVGILSFVLALAALYVATALLLEDARRKTVLPTLRPGPMKEAFSGDLLLSSMTLSMRQAYGATSKETEPFGSRGTSGTNGNKSRQVRRHR